MGFFADLGRILFGKRNRPVVEPISPISVAPGPGGAGTMTTIGSMEGPPLSRPMEPSLWTKPEPSSNLHTPAAETPVVSNTANTKPTGKPMSQKPATQATPGAATTTHSMPAKPKVLEFEHGGQNYRKTTPADGGAARIERLNAAGEVAGPVGKKEAGRVTAAAAQHEKMGAARQVNEGVKKGLEPVNKVAGDIKDSSKSTSSFLQKTKNLFFKSEGFVTKEIATLKEAGKEVPAKLKAGNARWGMMAGAAAGAVVLASVVASIGGKGSGKHAEQEMARRQEPQAGMGVA